MDIIWLLIRASWIKVFVAIASGLISGGCSAGLIALINIAIAQNSPQSLISPFATLVVLALIAGTLSQFLLIDLSQDAVYKLRLQLSSRILAAPLPQLEQLGPSQLLAVLTKDVQSISNTVFVIPALCINIAVIVGCLAYLGWLSGWAFLAVTVFLGSAIALIQLLISLAYRYLDLARKELDRLFEHFRGITEGTKELKLNRARRQLFFDEDLHTSATASRRYTKTASKIAAIATGSGQLLFFILIGLLLFGASQLIPAIQPVLPAYILTITYLLGPIESIVDRLPNLVEANVAIKKAQEMGLSLIESAEISSATREPVRSDWQKIALVNVSYTYKGEDPDSRFSVGPIDLTLSAGEIVFIIGGNGSGKSTFAKLVAGLYVPESGELRLDNQPIVESNRDGYRQLFSTVFSDFYLFERLVNDKEISLDLEAQGYLKKLQLEKKVSVQNGQLSTTALSQGQRKRLALLTAYLEDRSIYLFDEWAADQDPMFREIFYTQLLPELKQRGKTVIVISHDDRYFDWGDRTIKLDYGHIVSDSAA